MASKGSFDRKLDAALDEALKESFPASDSPAISGDRAARAGDPTLHRPLSHALRDLHRALVAVEAEGDAMLANPFDLLNAVMRDPRFAWLRLLSTLIVELDEAGDEGSFAALSDLAPYRATIERLIGPASPSDPDFRVAYLRCLQTSPDVVLANRAVREQLRLLPAPAA